MKTDSANREKARKLLNEYHELEMAQKHFERYHLNISVTFNSLLFSDKVAAPPTTIPLDVSEREYMKEYIKRRMAEIDKELEEL